MPPAQKVVTLEGSYVKTRSSLRKMSPQAVEIPPPIALQQRVIQCLKCATQAMQHGEPQIHLRLIQIDVAKIGKAQIYTHTKTEI